MRVRKIYYYVSPSGEAPFLDFMNSLEAKQRKKLEYSLKSAAINTGRLTEPQVKHFSIERYRRLYELREKALVVIRVVFVFDCHENIILLCPFVKRHKRDTNRALEESLEMIEHLDRDAGALREYVFSVEGCGR